MNRKDAQSTVTGWLLSTCDGQQRTPVQLVKQHREYWCNYSTESIVRDICLDMHLGEADGDAIRTAWVGIRQDFGQFMLDHFTQAALDPLYALCHPQHFGDAKGLYTVGLIPLGCRCLLTHHSRSGWSATSED